MDCVRAIDSEFVGAIIGQPHLSSTTNFSGSVRHYPQPDTGIHETKFVIFNGLAHKIVEWLRCRCRPDGEFPAGIVSSIYFDSRDWRFLAEKVNSDYLKTKVRIRWYQDIDSLQVYEASFMEVKYRIGCTRRKIRVRSPHSGAWLSGIGMDSSQLIGLPDLLMQEGVCLPGPLFPVFQITYKRRRFIEPVSGMRLSIDYDIHVPKVNPAMLSRFNPFHLRNAVFETKGDRADLPETLYPLTAMGCIKESFSKYITCYRKVMREDF